MVCKEDAIGRLFLNAYGTAYFGDPSLSPSISVSIAPTFKTTTVEGLLFNGLSQGVNYTIDAYSGNTLVNSVYFANLQFFNQILFLGSLSLDSILAQ